MNITRIRLHNYLSHPDTAFELNGARLTTIVGPNGAGKSALLEALKFVLFDDGRAKTDQLVRLGETEMSAEVVFDFAGSTYQAVRGRSTRAGGKSYLELHVLAVDGSWTPLTGDDIRSTQAAIAELLGLDADTFATAVFLGQGEANRFAEATAGERKRILGQVLGLERYAKAEAQARELARGLEARTEADRSHLQRTSDAIAELAPVRGVLAARLDERAAVVGEMAGCREALRSTEATLRDREAALAAASAHAGDIARVEAEVATLVERYTRTRDRRAASVHAGEVALDTISEAADVDEAIASLATMRLEVENLEQRQASERYIAGEITTQRQKVLDLERPYEQAYTSWKTGLEAQEHRVVELTEAARALKPVVCEKCKHPNVVDQADVRGQLRTARERLHELEPGEPKRPMIIDREQAALTRLEIRAREIVVPADIVAATRRQLAEMERTAARGEAIAAARATLEREQAAIAAADSELAEISAAGVAARARLEELNAAAAGLERIGRERDAAMSEATRIRASIDGLEVRARELEAAIARAEASIERLDALEAERAALAAKIAESSTELERLRKLVVAFGVGGIPARIIEGVLPELGRYANELLAELRPGMTLEIRAQRAKKDGKGVVEALDLVVRDDVGERPLAVFSGGERMSVSLALAVGLSRLVARRAGSRIESLVIDEPDGLDADARRAFGQALRVIAHRGELSRVVLVSHHPDLADFGDATYQVTKNGSGSVVEQVA